MSISIGLYVCESVCSLLFVYSPPASASKAVMSVCVHCYPWLKLHFSVSPNCISCPFPRRSGTRHGGGPLRSDGAPEVPRGRRERRESPNRAGVEHLGGGGLAIDTLPDKRTRVLLSNVGEERWREGVRERRREGEIEMASPSLNTSDSLPSFSS